MVIGGGIHGCSTALHLALRGLKPILVEKDYAGRHASGVNAGGVRQLARDLAEIPLSISSMDLWEHIGELVGDDCGFESHGTVLVAENDAELASFKARVDDLRLRASRMRSWSTGPSCAAWCRPFRIIARAAWSRGETARPIRFARRRHSASAPSKRAPR